MAGDDDLGDRAMFDDRLQFPLLDAKDRLDLVRRHGLHPDPPKAGPRVYRLAALDRTRKHT